VGFLDPNQPVTIRYWSPWSGTKLDEVLFSLLMSSPNRLVWIGLFAKMDRLCLRDNAGSVIGFSSQFLGASEVTIFSKRGSPRSESQVGWSLRKP
jgi:hypothetical protein